MPYEYIKALHIIFIVTWFSGLFYMVRLFVYHAEAQVKPEPEKTILTQQFNIMILRLWRGITVPSSILTLILGLSLWHEYNHFNDPPDWLKIKLVFVMGLYLYHGSVWRIYKQQRAGISKWKSTQLRIWNEVATLFLVSIVMLVVVKQQMSFVWGLAGLVAFAFVLMTAIKLYKLIRQKKEQ